MAYENFMCNKDFHPGNIRNLKKMYEAEQRQKQEERRQEELRQQYIKEQEIYKSKELIGKANPLNFMYEPPPGLEKDSKGGGRSGDSKQPEGGEGEPKLKFDWQRTGRNAPREEYAKDMELRDKPFGIEVRNVKCIKCGKWGHINTDRVCPLYGKAKPAAEGEDATPLPTPLPDLDTMEDGLIFKQCVRDRIVDDRADNQQILLSDDEETQIGELLSGLSKKERKRVLRKLAKTEGRGEGEQPGRRGEGQRKKKRKHDGKKKKKLKTERGRKKRRHGSSERSSSESESESEDDERERKRKKQKKVKKEQRKKSEWRERSHDASSGSHSDSEDDRDRKTNRKRRYPSESDDSSDSEIEPKHTRREEREGCRDRHSSGTGERERHHDRHGSGTEERERRHDRHSSGHGRERPRNGGRSRAKKEGSHYERGRTHHDRDSKRYHSSSDGYHSRSKH